MSIIGGSVLMFHGCSLLRSTVATLYLARLSRYTNLQKMLSRYTSYTPIYPQFEHCMWLLSVQYIQVCCNGIDKQHITADIKNETV